MQLKYKKKRCQIFPTEIKNAEIMRQQLKRNQFKFSDQTLSESSCNFFFKFLPGNCNIVIREHQLKYMFG